MSDIGITFAVLGAVIVLLVLDRVPIAVVAIGAALALYFAGARTLEQTLAGFSDPTVVFIVTLFIVSEGLDASGLTAWIGQQLIHHSGGTWTRLIVIMMTLVALLTALISLNGAVTALLPVIIMISVRLGRSPSQSLMPLVFGAHAGSLLTLTGTPVNVLVSHAALTHGGREFGYFEFALVGVPLLVGTILIVVYFGGRLLPDRKARLIPPDLSRHAHTLATQYRLSDDPLELLSRTRGLVEVVIPPRSELVGEKAFPGMCASGGDAVILAIQRGGEDIALEGDAVLTAGDTVLLQGSWAALSAKDSDPNVMVVDSPQLIRRQAVPLGFRAAEAIIILGAMILLLSTGLLPPVIVGLVAATAMVLLRVVGVTRAYRAIPWTTVVLLAAMIPLSTAMEDSGAADLIASVLVDVVGQAGPIALLAGLFVITAVLGQVISNMATALIVIPIAIAAALDMHVSLQPVLMCVTVASAGAFLTPISTPVNLIVMGPAGYQFGDYWKLGLPLLAMFGAVAVFLVPRFWPF